MADPNVNIDRHTVICVCKVQCMFSHMWICENQGLWNIVFKSDKSGLKINRAQGEKGNRHFIGRKTCFF